MKKENFLKLATTQENKEQLLNCYQKVRRGI
uniref:Uncharacterized protein n=1 Tax=Tetranychus urticae TaxID=32264 RepID=T1K9L4_TETUR